MYGEQYGEYECWCLGVKGQQAMILVTLRLRFHRWSVFHIGRLRIPSLRKGIRIFGDVFWYMKICQIPYKETHSLKYSF